MNDIKLYFQVGQTKASEINQKAKRLHPRDSFSTSRRDDILKVCNVDLDRELLIIKMVNVKQLEEKEYVN